MERPVNYGFLVSYFVVGSSAGAVEAAFATVGHSDIRGSEPHNRDPSGAASD